jgi:3-oxoacyl-[acyl-carrier-protein] synthase III
MNTFHSIITGTGSYVPKNNITNEDFLSKEFYDSKGEKINKTNREIIDKFQEITTISERKYASDDLITSDIAYFAAVEAIKSANIDQEEIDYIIVAHNFGNTRKDNRQPDYVPCLAARVKCKLGIQNPYTVSYDITFGCPGWLQAMIQADYYIRSGDAKKILVIGAEILSRVSDPHDRDSMLYADGAGATILESREDVTPVGILAHKTRSDTFSYCNMLYMGNSNNPGLAGKNELFLKMIGRKLYQYALETVPQAIKACLDSCQISIENVNKILIHQANGKMDEAILKRLYALYDIVDIPKHIMPMTISSLGNSSVATLPTLLDLLLKGKLKNQEIKNKDIIIFASVGAGMNINAMVYKM